MWCTEFTLFFLKVCLFSLPCTSQWSCRLWRVRCLLISFFSLLIQLSIVMVEHVATQLQNNFIAVWLEIHARKLYAVEVSSQTLNHIFSLRVLGLFLNSDLEKSVEELQRNSSVNHGLVTEQDVEQKSKELRMLGETLTDLKSRC